MRDGVYLGYDTGVTIDDYRYGRSFGNVTLWSVQTGKRKEKEIFWFFVCIFFFCFLSKRDRVLSKFDRVLSKFDRVLLQSETRRNDL